jgi:hypothetical protein
MGRLRQAATEMDRELHRHVADAERSLARALDVCRQASRGNPLYRRRESELTALFRDKRLSGRALETFQRDVMRASERKAQNVEQTLKGLLGALRTVGGIDAVPSNDPDLWPETTRSEVSRQRREDKKAEKARAADEQQRRRQQEEEL